MEPGNRVVTGHVPRVPGVDQQPRPRSHLLCDDEQDNREEQQQQEEECVSLEEEGAVMTWVSRLDALRRARQYYDVAVVGAGGPELCAHRAVLGAALPALLPLLVPSNSTVRVPVPGGPLRALLDYVYTGRLVGPALPLYRAAWTLRADTLAAQLAELLARRPRPASCLRLRALPDLPPGPRDLLDKYIADNFSKVCEEPSFAALPALRLELCAPPADLPCGGEEGDEEGDGEGDVAEEGDERQLAGAALRYVRRVLGGSAGGLPAVCARRHLVFLRGHELRDRAARPAAPGDDPALMQYRRDLLAAPPADTEQVEDVTPAAHDELAPRVPVSRWAVVCVAPGGPLLLETGGGLLRVLLRRGGGGAAPVTAAPPLAPLGRGRCAHGAAAVGGRLLVCGGHDRAEVLRSVEAWTPGEAGWETLPDMPTPRARFALVAVGGRVLAAGGSDGQRSLGSLLELGPTGWETRAALPGGGEERSAACGAPGGLLVAGGGGGGAGAGRAVHVYSVRDDKWRAGPALREARGAAAAVWWRGAAWLLGGCDAWRCLRSTERLPAGARGWLSGPPLPTARRSLAGVAWRGALLALGGSDGGRSLRRVDVLAAPRLHTWRRARDMREPRAAHQAVVLDDTLYVVGGYSGSEFLSSVECLSSPDDEWSTLRDPASGPPRAPGQTPPEEPETPREDSDDELRGDDDLLVDDWPRVDDAVPETTGLPVNGHAALSAGT